MFTEVFQPVEAEYIMYPRKQNTTRKNENKSEAASQPQNAPKAN
jgi:hypothetical protein